MPWAALDDGFYDHPKIVALGNEAAGVYARVIAYCARHLTDGVVPREVVDAIAGKKRLQITTKLIEANMLLDYDTQLVVRDYLNYNPSRAKVTEDRWRAANKKRQQRKMPPLPAPDFDQMSPLLSLGLSPGTSQGSSRGLSPGTRAGAPDRATPPLVPSGGGDFTSDSAAAAGAAAASDVGEDDEEMTEEERDRARQQFAHIQAMLGGKAA